ncbi:18527_t:CDS:2 [Funneliformis geosporum]|uniref:3269_t:CDS:1 n=1 Tax=Funneliformis geosporum TaxID=1117311 RepID=A0A9W4SEC4_9GLOM|nr:3269_t:CDS:2 [Funneliformis geosporum]CAI2167289.1 18527_t:CDS:2 [Funneliformis geosporum]
MTSKISYIFVLFVLVCLSAISTAIPITDVSSTKMAITETKTSNSERFVVAVQRVDDLVDDNGKLLAERIEAVIMNFELKDDLLLVNKVPVELDVDSVQVIEAQIVPANINAEQLEQYADNFDIGLVTVQVLPVAESLKTEEEGVSLRRISITVRVIEIDGVNVVQAQGGIEKVLEFKLLEIADGDQDVIVPFYPEEDLTSANQDKMAKIQNKIMCAIRSFASRVRHWWRCSSRFTRIVIASLFLTALFGVFFMAIPTVIQAIIVLVRQHHSSSPYSAIAVNDDESLVEQVIFITDEEKRALLEQEKELDQ